MTKNKIDEIYQTVLDNSEIVFQMRGDFETYMVMGADIPGFAIGYDEKSGKYGFKRYDLINALYEACKIPPEIKPDYASLYRKTKDTYMIQAVIDNIEHLYD